MTIDPKKLDALWAAVNPPGDVSIATLDIHEMITLKELISEYRAGFTRTEPDDGTLVLEANKDRTHMNRIARVIAAEVGAPGGAAVYSLPVSGTNSKYWNACITVAGQHFEAGPMSKSEADAAIDAANEALQQMQLAAIKSYADELRQEAEAQDDDSLGEAAMNDYDPSESEN